MSDFTITKDQAEEVAYAADLEPEAVYDDYSGRGMFGRECFGIVTNKPLVVAAALAQVQRELQERAVPYGLADWRLMDVLADARTDSMGYETIVYFPGVTVVED